MRNQIRTTVVTAEESPSNSFIRPASDSGALITRTVMEAFRGGDMGATMRADGDVGGAAYADDPGARGQDMVFDSETAGTTVDEVRAIAALPDKARRERAVEAFVAARTPMFRRHARRLCSINGVSAPRYLDDVLQIVLESAWNVLRGLVENPAGLDSMPSFEGRVWMVSRPLVRSELDKAKSPASGMVGAQRRAREVRRTQLQMLSRGHSNPTTSEVITATNERLTELRADAARQGLLVTAEDVTVSVAPMSLDDSEVASCRVESHDATAADMARKVLVAARREDDLTYHAARIYVTEALGPQDPNKPDVTRLVAQELGVPPRRARAIIRRVLQVAQEELKAGGYGPVAAA